MKRSFITALLICILIASNSIYAQGPGGKNLIKVNLTSIAISHYAIQYERVLNKRHSIAIGIGVSPNVGLPFKSNLLDQFGDNEDGKRAIESTKFTKYTVTPEFRFYLGKKPAPAGFYIAPFLRYTHMSISQDYIFTTQADVKHIPHLTGNLDGVGAGFLIGAQWLFGKKKNISLDWWIAGPFYGVIDGKFHADDKNDDMTAADKAKLKTDIEDTKLPGWTVEANVGQNVVDAKVKGAFYGIRLFGLALGYRF